MSNIASFMCEIYGSFNFFKSQKKLNLKPFIVKLIIYINYIMIPIEKAIDEFDANHNETIEKYQQMIWDAMDNYDINFSKVLYETALTSNECCDNVDKEYYALFPEIKKIGESACIFNPDVVMDVRNEKEQYYIKKEIKKWNMVTGLLPNRRVIYRYTVSTRKNTDFWYCSKHNECYSEKPSNSDKIIEQVFGLDFAKQSNRTFDCGCSLDDAQMYRYNEAFGKKHKLNINSVYLQTVEVDNYLNIYYPSIDLYLMINKTSFPIMPFYLNKLTYNQRPVEKDYVLDIHEIDQYYEVESYNKLIPNNVPVVLEFFERFRNIKSFKKNLKIIPEDIVSDDDSDESDVSNVSDVLSDDEYSEYFSDSDIETVYLDSSKTLFTPLIEKNESKTCWTDTSKQFTIKECTSLDNFDYIEDAKPIKNKSIDVSDIKYMIKDIVLEVFDKINEKNNTSDILHQCDYCQENFARGENLKKHYVRCKAKNMCNTNMTGEDCMVDDNFMTSHL